MSCASFTLSPRVPLHVQSVIAIGTEHKPSSHQPALPLHMYMYFTPSNFAVDLNFCEMQHVCMIDQACRQQVKNLWAS